MFLILFLASKSGVRNFTTKASKVKGPDRFVVEGKAGRVGVWLMLTSANMLILGALGGFTKNLRYGQPVIKWRPGNAIPKTEEDWQKEYDDFKACPEFNMNGNNVELEEFMISRFKNYWYLTSLGKIFGPGHTFLAVPPMFYFLARGYFKGPMKRFCLVYSGLLAAIGFQGMYMDNKRPGTVEGEPLPFKDPNQRAIHYGL